MHLVFVKPPTDEKCKWQKFPKLGNKNSWFKEFSNLNSNECILTRFTTVIANIVTIVETHTYVVTVPSQVCVSRYILNHTATAIKYDTVLWKCAFTMLITNIKLIAMQCTYVHTYLHPL